MRKLLILFLILIPSLIYGGVYFDGVDDEVNLTPLGLAVDEVFSYTVWIYPIVLSKDIINFIDEVDTYSTGIMAQANGSLWYRRWVTPTAGKDIFTAVDSIKVNKWSLIAFGWDGASMWASVNNSSRTYLTVGNLRSVMTKQRVGYSWNSGWFNGEIGEIRFYKKTLLVNEVKNIIARYNPAEPSMKGLWVLDIEGYDGKKSFDLSGNNNTGTHTGTSNGNSNPPILMQPIYAGD